MTMNEKMKLLDRIYAIVWIVFIFFALVYVIFFYYGLFESVLFLEEDVAMFLMILTLAITQLATAVVIIIRPGTEITTLRKGEFSIWDLKIVQKIVRERPWVGSFIFGLVFLMLLYLSFFMHYSFNESCGFSNQNKANYCYFERGVAEAGKAGEQLTPLSSFSCERISESSLKAACIERTESLYYEAGVSKNCLFCCPWLASTTLREKCISSINEKYYELAITDKDSGYYYCHIITDKELKENCCYTIENETLKEMCIEEVFR